MNDYTVPLSFLALVFVLGCGFVGSQKEAQVEDEDARLDTVLVEGTFDGKEGITTSGSYRIGRNGDDLTLVLEDDFQTEDGPDLYVVLSPISPEEATGENVMEGAALKIDSLRSLAGRQTYDLAEEQSLDTFESVAIHCIQFSHLYGVAELD